jgi:hypothetical protein
VRPVDALFLRLGYHLNVEKKKSFVEESWIDETLYDVNNERTDKEITNEMEATCCCVRICL